MYKFLTKNGQAIGFLTGALVSGIFLAIALPNAGNYDFDNMSDPDKYASTIFNFGISGAIFMIAVAFIALVGFGLYHIATNFKSSVKGLIGVGILAVIFIVAYATASSEITPYLQGAVDNYTAGGATFTPDNLKLISAGITTAIALTLVAGGAFVFSEIRNFFK